MPSVKNMRTVDGTVGFSLAASLCALLLVAPLALPQHATATPSDPSPEPGQTRLVAAGLGALRGEADRVEAQTAELDRRLERLIEDYDRARQSQDDAAGRLGLARLRLARASGELQTQEALLQRRLSDIYKMGDYSLLTVLVTASGFDDARARLRFFGLIGEQDAGQARERARLVDRVRALALQIETERDGAARLTRAVEGKERAVRARLAERELLLAGLDQRIKREVQRRREAARHDAERLARAAGVDLSRVRATPQQLAVVQEALRYLGIPYLYGGAAPSTGFDCSGLVMYAYAKFGVDLPHFAAWQEEQGTSVPFDQLQPADLVFFGSPIHHVGMYIGNGRFLHAPHTGDVVRIAVLAERTDLTAACRYRLGPPGD